MQPPVLPAERGEAPGGSAGAGFFAFGANDWLAGGGAGRGLGGGRACIEPKIYASGLSIYFYYVKNYPHILPHTFSKHRVPSD
jgi:hypothetical protein